METTAAAQLAPFLDPLALALVGGGTLLAMFLRTPFRDAMRGISALRVLPRRRFRADPGLAQITALGRIVRRHGAIALDKAVIADPDIAAAAAAIVDGATPDEVRDLLHFRAVERAERHRGAADLWTGAAEAAPAMGMIGTLVGLVKMFATMNDPDAIGGAMAVALLTTLYGAILANLVAQPIAARLRRRAGQEARERERLVAPLAELAAIEPPRRATWREAAA
ncbi:motility protein A [Stakelama tenebrarum]|uniref:Biopolymer transporter ExbB n=1 Tax=Stakelama tenebrarum TaxID=2711215 RepID=A0A6G6Y1C5_9SPHN|nr:MotA/TolQ/ExbB proton channel family protein [Sphingosinithalassobacter tenebrarum]QIG78710.1 biopolymer transporter ExbB [Sphingosinithalassobacter tenebrarum]